MNQRSWDPGALMQLSGGYWQTCVLHAAVKLGIFSAIEDIKVTPDMLAAELDCSVDGIRRLLDALVAMELLIKDRDEFTNIPSGRELLCKDSPKYIGHMIMHHHHLMASWSQLDQGVRSGAPVRTRSSFSDPIVRESFLMGMFNTAMGTAPHIVPALDLSRRKQLIDLGGGPGTYAIQFCLAFPQLAATVFDLETTRPFAEKTIEKFGLTDRIQFQAGNFLEDEIQGRYDVAWLSHMLHGEGPEECQKIIQKAVAALEPGAMIIVHEFILNNTMDGPLFPALFTLNMLLGTPSGQSYSEKQIMDMLSAAGAKDIRRVPVETPTESGIITAVI